MRDRLAILDAMSGVIERRQELMEVLASASDADAARGEIQTRFGFSEAQALAVLDLQVRRFAGRERSRIIEEAQDIRRQLG